MKILFISLNDFGFHCLKEVIAKGGQVGAILTRKDSGVNADFRDFTPLACQHKIPIHYIEDINSDAVFEIIRGYNPEIIFCFGWSQIIGRRLLDFPRLGIIGVHPAKLPFNRGRHPLIWALVLGLKKSALTFFRMDEGADTGQIISQRGFKINYNDDAAAVYEKIKKSASIQIREIMAGLKSGHLKQAKQNIRAGNWWRKRAEIDGLIDWRMSSRAIYNLVRALTHPYPGAHCCYKGQDVKIWKVKEINFRDGNLEPGKVLQKKNKRLIVKTYDGAVEILKHDFPRLPQKGEYLE